MKRHYLILGILIVASIALLAYSKKSVDLGAITATTEADIIAKIESLEGTGKVKYTQYKADAEIAGIDAAAAGLSDVKVVEYISPKGPGYQIFLFRDTGGKYPQVKTYGYGPEAADRTFDWQ